MSHFTGVDDPLYKAWVKEHTKPGKRVPSPAQAEVLIRLKQENKKSTEEKSKTKFKATVRKMTKQAETKAKAEAKKAAKLIPAVGKKITKKTQNTVSVTVNNENDPEQSLQIIESVVDKINPSTFVYKRIDTEGNIQSTHQSVAYNRSNLKNVLFGSKNSRVSGDDTGATRFVFRATRGIPSNFSLRDSINSNCVLEAIKKFYGSKFSSKVEGQLLWFFHKYYLGENGVTKEIMGELAKKLRLRLIVKNAIDRVWYDSDPQDKLRRKHLEFFALNNHAEPYVPICDFMEAQVVYQDPVEATADLHQRKRYFVRVDEQDRANVESVTPEAIWTGSCIYKTFRPSSVSGMEKDDTDRRFFLCTNEDQFRYKDWVRKNNLRPLVGVYFDIFRNADNYLTVQRFSSEDSCHLYDMNRAYPSFKTNPLYSKYKLIIGYVCLYNTTGVDLGLVLDVAGISYVDTITWHNSFVESTGWVQAGSWYNHIILYVLVSMGWATITVSNSCLCRQPEDLDFPFGSGKFYNNAFIGRLVTGASSTTRVEYTRVYSSDLTQVLFDYEVDPLCRGRTMVYDGYESKYVSATLDCEDRRNQLHQIHGCIIAYQQVTMMQAMVLASEHTKVIAYNTDGFHVRDKFPMKCSFKPGRFKYENKPILYQGTAEPMPPKPYELSWDCSTLPDFRVELPVTLITGPAGCGKSYVRIEKQPGVDAIVVCPLNELVVDTSKRTTAVVSTYHKYFGMHSGGDYRELDINEVVIADEVSMMPGDDLKSILDVCKERRVCLDLIGDVREMDGVWDTDQMQPVIINTKVKYTWDSAIRTIEFTHREIISDIRRQNDEDSAFCDSLRGLPFAKMRAVLIARLGLHKWTDVINENAIGLSATHEHNHLYNSSIVRKFRPTQVPGRCIKTIKKDGEIVEARGMIKTLPIGLVWCNRKSVHDETPKGCRYELAYFRTANAVQGQSIGVPYIINVASCSARFLYTAVSRCRSLDSVVLVSSAKDWPSK
jgi:hypothetical protein